MTQQLKRKFFRMLADERGSQNAKSAVGILFFFLFVGGGALLNSSALPLSYNIAFGDSGGTSSGSGGGGGGGGGSGGGYSYSPKTKARIEYLRLTVYYDNGKTAMKPLGSVSNDVSVGGTGWLYPENTGIEDGNRSAAEMQFGESSYYMRALNFGFAIPKSSTINGITLDIKRSAEGPDSIKDYSVRLVVGGTITGAEYAKEESWSAQDEFRIYGNSNDLWETKLTPSDVNNGSFGVVIAARNGGSKLISSAQPTNQLALTQPTQAIIPPSISANEQKTDIESLIKSAEKEKRGKNVVLLQDALIAAARGPAADELAAAGSTGYYGPVTKKAAAEWKKSNGAKPVPQEISTPKTIKPSTGPVKQSSPITASAADQARAIQTPLIRGYRGPDVAALQKIIITWNAGPEAKAVAEVGATGIYGPLTERAVAELQDVIINAVKGPEAWKLASALLKYTKGSWGDITKAAAIEYLGNLR
ncbi:MAG: peptidoglycan-binding protein [bacterium]|nr:peptidoglycan-binding protein [bacterium]